MYFKSNIRYLRNKADYTLEEMANKLGYKSYTTIQKWEAGTSEPRMEVIQKISAVFNVPMDQLINFDLKGMDIRNGSRHIFEPDETIKHYVELLMKDETLQFLIMEAEDATPSQREMALKMMRALKQ